ncbi:MAG: NTP transferase domain-containing protein [Thermoanaerobaculia bacterium]|nr:NTP transferase domain-containing protein [Thermoanaerobaculia bacterium]
MMVTMGMMMKRDPKAFAISPGIVALLPAAGHARRLGTVDGSKEVLPLGSSPAGEETSTLERLLDGLEEAGISRVLIVLRVGKWDIPTRLAQRRGGPTTAFAAITSSQSVPETLCAGLKFLGDLPILLAFPDILYDPPEIFAEVVQELAQGADLVLGLVPTDRPDKSDMVELDAEGRPIDIVIKSDRTDLVWAWGFAAWGSRFSDLLRSTVSQATAPLAAELQAGRELFIGDVVRRAIALDFDVRAVPFPQALFLDIGTPEDLERARGRLKASDS